MTSPSIPPEVEEEERSALHDPGSIVPPIATLLLGVAVIVVAGDLPEAGLSADPGPGGMPRMVGIGLVILSIFLLWRREPHERLPRGGEAFRVIATLMFTLGYTLTLRPLGFLIATAIFLAAEMILIGLRRPLLVIVMAAVMSAGVYALFRYGLEVPLPATRIGSVTL